MDALKLLALTISIAWAVNSQQIVNKCCRPPQVYSKTSSECVLLTIESRAGRASIFDQDENGTEVLKLSKKFVKRLDGRDETEVKFKIEYELPTAKCSKGLFITTFCTALNASVSTGYDTIAADHTSPAENSGDERTVEVRVCNPTCSREVPCVRKCCDIDQVWDFNNGTLKLGRPKRCVSPRAQSWRPHFYSSENRKVPTAENDKISPHYFIAHPRTFYNKSTTTLLAQEQIYLASEKLSWIFRMGLNKNYYHRKSRYSWTDSSKNWGTSCVEGVLNSGYRDSSEFKGTEAEDVLFEGFPKTVTEMSVTTSKVQISIYSTAIIISALFILMTFVVHALLLRVGSKI